MASSDFFIHQYMYLLFNEIYETTADFGYNIGNIKKYNDRQ